MLHKYRRHGIGLSEIDKLSGYPALQGASEDLLVELATWADIVTIRASDAIGGLDLTGRWAYLVANPTRRVLVDAKAGTARVAIGLGRAIRSSPPAPLEIIAVDPIELLAIPSTRLAMLVDSIPRLLRLATEEACPPVSLFGGSNPTAHARTAAPQPAAA